MVDDLSRRVVVGVVLWACGCTEPKIVPQDTWLPPPAPADFACADLRAASVFCDDFDSGSLILSWNKGVEIQPAGNGAVARTEEGAVSEPSALVAETDGPYDDVDYAAAYVGQSFRIFEDRPFRARISFQMRVEHYDRNHGARISVFQFLFGDLDDRNVLALNLEPRFDGVAAQFTEASSADGVDGLKVADFKEIESDAWLEVVLDLEIAHPNGNDNHATMTLDGEPIFDDRLAFDLSGLSPRMELGIPWVDTEHATDTWAIRFDNVLVEMQPLDTRD